MNSFAIIAAVSVAGLIAYNAVSYYHASGSVADRLAAAWKSSMTIFVGIWAAIASVLTAGLDGLAQMTGDPMFSQWADAVKVVIPAQWHPYIPIAGMGAMMLARLRTAPGK